MLLLLIVSVVIAGTQALSLKVEDLTNQPECLHVTIQEICPNENVTFWLYNDQVEDYRLDDFDVTTIQQALFNDNPIKILLHGFTGNKSFHPNIAIRPVYQKLKYNVISIDYGPVVPRPCYLQSVQNADTVGDCFTNFIKLLVTNRIESRTTKQISISDIHVLGFSLGAQIAGNMGSKLKNKHKMILPRITALDAASPGYVESDINEKSAKFVDAYHTNTGAFGKLLPVGHVEFYFNYFILQNGCNIIDVDCNHDRAHLYFAESITDTDPLFCGYKPSNKTDRRVAGEHVDYSATGLYRVKTNDQPLYAMDKKNICK